MAVTAGGAPGGGGGGGAASNGANGGTGQLVVSYEAGSGTVAANIIRFLLAVPATEMPNGALVMVIYTTGAVTNLNINYGTGGNLSLTGWSGYTVLFTTGAQAWGVNGAPVLISVELQQAPNGSDLQWGFWSVTLEGDIDGVSGTLTGPAPCGQVQRVVAGPQGVINDTALGHIAVQYAWSDPLDMVPALAAYAGELAADRFLRLCGEEGIPATLTGNNTDTVAMGSQLPGLTLTAHLQQCAVADMGLMYEPRDSFGLAYRTRASLCNQQAAAVLNYAAAQLAAPLSPTDDDQHSHNNITVTRQGGSSAHAELDSGPMSTDDPPDGIGGYPSSVTVNTFQDGQPLADIAGWLLNLGTQDELRYPVVNVSLARAEVGDSYTAIQAVDAGDLIQVTSPPPFLPPGTISQLALGFTETFTQFSYDIAWNCVPEQPYETAVVEDQVLSRLDTVGSVLHAACGAADTSIAVDLAGQTSWPWTVNAADLPFDIMVGGEQMTVTAVGGATPPQVLTVTRSVNGIVKAHGAGDAVALAFPAVISLGDTSEFTS